MSSVLVRIALPLTWEEICSGWNLALTAIAVQKLAVKLCRVGWTSVTTNILALLCRMAECTHPWCRGKHTGIALEKIKLPFWSVTCRWQHMCKQVGKLFILFGSHSGSCWMLLCCLVPILYPNLSISWNKALHLHSRWGWKASSCLAFSLHPCRVLFRLVPKDLSLNCKSGIAGDVIFFPPAINNNVSSRNQMKRHGRSP